MLTSKIPENLGLEGVRASLGRCWKAPGGSVALPGRSGELAGGLGEVLDVMLAPKMAATPQKIEKKCGSKRQAVPE